MLKGEERSWPCSVVRCDREGCDAEYVVGPGMGDSLSDDDIDALEAAGWTGNGSRDFCPIHAADADEESDE